MTSEPRAAWAAHLPPGQRFSPADLLAGGTLVAAWAKRWASEPDRAVLHGEGGWLTGGAMEERSREVAGRLHRAGIRAGDRVLVSGPNTVDLVVAHIACLRLGAVVVPVNGAYRAREVAQIVHDSRPRAAIVDDPAWRGWIHDVDAACLVLSTAVEVPTGAAPPLDAVAAGAPALVGYTSGTTGAPKGAVLSHANLLAGAAAVRLAWRWAPDDRLVLCLPLFHMHGLGVGLHGTLLAGASAVLLDGFDPDRVLDAAREHGASLFFGVPTMYHRLAASPRVAELARLRLCVCGSAPLPAALHESLALAGVRVLERYGMTETVMLVSNPYEGERRAGSVGVPLPGVEVRLSGSGDAREIEVRGPNVFRAYWERPDATADAFTDDGWFRTGDLGETDTDGYLRIVGRKKELIITGGFNVHPRDVEEALSEHPAVVEIAVRGAPSAEWGEEIEAFVVPRSGEPAPTLDALRTWAADRLARHKLPRRLVLVDALPRNALGKVVRSELRSP